MGSIFFYPPNRVAAAAVRSLLGIAGKAMVTIPVRKPSASFGRDGIDIPAELAISRVRQIKVHARETVPAPALRLDAHLIRSQALGSNNLSALYKVISVS